jgi:peptidoglycan/LPS O-acetylase OafA/YrhL
MAVPAMTGIDPIPLDPGMSLYLDAVRLLAALSVFGFHLGYGKLIGTPFAFLHVFGSNAVIVFFVLSGFVISHVLATSEKSARAYALARLSRLYSVVIPALILTIVLDTLGTRADPSLYPIPLTMYAFVADLFFVNAQWYHGSAFGSMVTYWSLGFEAWYYVVAGLFVFCRGYGRIVWPLLALLFVGPDVAKLLPLWLLGAALYRIRGYLPPNALLGTLLFALTIALFFLARGEGFFEPITRGIESQDARQLLIIYASGLLFAAHLAGAQMLAPWLAKGLTPIGKPIRWTAGASFTLYLAHVPLAFFIVSHDPWRISDWRSMALIIAGTLGGTLLLAEVSERRKAMWKTLFAHLWPDAAGREEWR